MDIKRQKLWVFSELFFPEETSTAYILTKISEKLSQKYDVEVICTYPSYDNFNKRLTLQNNNIKVTRIKSFKGNKNNNIHRILKFGYLSIAFAIHLATKVKKKDHVFTVTNPAPFLILAAIIKTIKKFRLTILVHDVFPENTIPASYMNPKSIVYKLLKVIFTKAYSKYDTIIVLGRDMLELFRKKLTHYKKQPHVVVIENWADTEHISPQASNSKSAAAEDKIVFQFAGNLGAIQGLDYLFSVISKITNDHLLFAFIGNGKLKEPLETMAKEQGLKNIIFKPPFKRVEQNEVLNSCDIGIVSLSKGMQGLGVPSKTYNILSAGKPILFIGDKESEISLLVKEHNIGYSFGYMEEEELIHFLNALNPEIARKHFQEKGQKARCIAKTLYSEESILTKYLELI
ncbi:glycosyltransferase family 4 protein [Niabella aurantiaca]|uniref:glycosyltransferase family 4 protein n=1 Tax=Niabella aurantiaca TaxID=379900 RepID=UPI0003674315|nr:glycosyltransferase family 4 protein [Niabella aurantiaca]